MFDLGLFVTGRDCREGFGQPGVGLDGVELAGLDERGDDGPVFGTGVVTGEQGVFPVQGDGADGALHGVAVDLDAAIREEEVEALPMPGDVFQGLTCRGLGRDPGAACGQCPPSAPVGQI